MRTVSHVLALSLILLSGCPDGDPDGDGLTNAEEKDLGTDTKVADSDGDGLDDGYEVNTTGTDPLDADTDGDGLDDGYEVGTSSTDPAVADTDEDGLSDGEEVDGTLTDPLDDDCDDDDYLDGEEIEAGTNPHYEYSHPYTGGYAVGFCDELPDEASAGPTGTGNYGSDNWTAYQAGDVMANYEWIDSYGELVSLYSFCGKTIMMAVSTMWCGPCKTLAAQLPGIQEEYVDQEFTAIEFLTQDNGGARPDVDDLVQWRDTYELDGIPVVAQERAAVWKKFFDADGYVPSTIIIGPDMTVLSMDEGIHDPAAFLD